MKLIFLDIDGVLNYLGGKSVTSDDLYFVEDEKLILLKQIIDATGAYLVLSSSWRYGWREAEQGRASSVFARNYFRLRDRFHEFGMAFFSKTPMLSGFSREMEIRYWLSNWEHEHIESFVILDDDEHEFHELSPYLVQTKCSEGLKKEHVIKAIGILGPIADMGDHFQKREKLQKAGVDYRKGLTHFGQDEEMYQKYLLDFANEKYTQDAISRVHNQDVSGAFETIRNLNSLVEYVCIPSIAEILQEITETLRNGKTEGVLDGLEYVRVASEEIKSTILKIRECGL